MFATEILRLNHALRALNNCSSAVIHAAGEPRMPRDISSVIVDNAGCDT